MSCVTYLLSKLKVKGEIGAVAVATTGTNTNSYHNISLKVIVIQ